ncbi:MAG: phosphotransferase [Tepidisphaeraceae bacterium]
MIWDIGSDRVAAIVRRVAHVDGDLRAHPPVPLAQADSKRLSDALLCTSGDSLSPMQLFNRLRWGGQAVFVTPDREEAVRFSLRLAGKGFEITQKPAALARRPLGLPIPFLSPKAHYFVARKVQLIVPGETTDRFTYHVHLECPDPGGTYEVVKEVPSLEMVMARLRAKWPDLGEEVIEKRARKFSHKIFPVFLTREAAILKIVNRDLPEAYRGRVPCPLKLEKDERGYARRLHMSWLRNGGEPLSQLEFARQSADLLRALHDDVGVMHLDLRLDNFVITPAGVGFVDFGSAVRADENLKQSPLLSSLFEELMRTSEIQRMLFRMTKTGEVTSEAISGGLHRVDKAVDYFYLAMQISSPHANPDLKDLIQYDKQGPEARLLSKLTEQILRPADPSKPPFRSAADILRGIEDLRSAETAERGADREKSGPVEIFTPDLKS